MKRALLPLAALGVLSAADPCPPPPETERQPGGPAGSIRALERTLESDPSLAWVRLPLARMYLKADPKDEARAVDHLKLYIQACPYNLEPYAELTAIGDREFAAEAARRLRRLLPDRTGPEAIALYPTLWQTELRVASGADQDEAHWRISEDLARLKRLDPTNDRGLETVLREGARLLGDAQPKMPSAAGRFARELQAWRTQHSRPTDPAAQKKYAEALLQASGEWIGKYPGEFIPLHERFVALDMLDAPNSEIEAAGDTLIRKEDSRATVSGTSVRVHVGEVWLRHGIRLADIPGIVEKGLERSDQNRSDSRMFGWGILAEAYLKTGQPNQAREVLGRMRVRLEANRGSRPPAFASWLAQYYTCMAQLAEKENNKLDQLTYLERALATHQLNAAQAEKAHALWKELGGSAEGWKVFSEPPETGRGGMPVRLPTASRAETGKPLPDFELKDLEGRTWTVARFQGRMTLVNLWATWCAPCLKELPYVQKLYDRIKDRAGMQVVTFNVDEDEGVVQPFLRKNGYSFPVLPAREYIKALLPTLSIPRTWILDPSGIMREESVGFGGSGSEWVERALAKLRE